MDIGTVIELDEVEQELVTLIAKKRFDSAMKNKLQDTRAGICDPYIADLEGFAAEFAFCKMANCFPDFEIGVHRAKNDKGDCTYCGYSIDVKTSKNTEGNLIVKPWKKGRVEAYAFFTGTFPTYTFRGFYPSFLVFLESNLRDVFGTENYVIHQKKMMELDGFFDVMVAEPERFAHINHKALEGVL